jgi:cobalt-zinc-cadmium efflux system outer membrane protein
MSIKHQRLAPLMLAAFACALEVRAQQPQMAERRPLPSNVTIEQAVGEAVANNLSLVAERMNITIAEARMITARLRPNPVLSLESDLVNHKLLSTGGDVNQEAFRTDFILERGGKRESRIAVAENARGVAQLNLLNSIRTLVLDVQSGFVDALLAKESLALSRENLKVFDEIVRVNSARVAAGDLAQVELLRTRLAALQFGNAVLAAESRLRIARNRLQGLMGRKQLSETFDVSGDLRRDAAPALAEVRRQASALRPDLQALERDQARSQAEIRLQIAQGKADYTVGAEFRREKSNLAQGNAAHLFFSAPVPVFNRNQGEVARARQEHEQIAARIRALETTIDNEVSNAYLQYQTAGELLEKIERDMLGQAREVRGTTEYSYRRGEASLVEFLDAARAFNDTVQSYNEARAEYARGLYLIDSITGKEVNP